ncbi:hypothetical protein BH20BAC1_BH20BAC1_17380 [soil metagenome]
MVVSLTQPTIEKTKKKGTEYQGIPKLAGLRLIINTNVACNLKRRITTMKRILIYASISLSILLNSCSIKLASTVDRTNEQIKAIYKVRKDVSYGSDKEQTWIFTFQKMRRN